MSALDAAQHLVGTFVAPFLRGDTCEVGTPYGPEIIEPLRAAFSLNATLEEAIARFFQEIALTTEVTPAPLDEDGPALLWAMHALCASCHPQSQAFYARSHTFVDAATDVVRALPRAFDPARLVTRHAIVGRALQAFRTDTTVRWWAGKATYQGRSPPERLKWWPGMRRVETDEDARPVWSLAVVEGSEEARVARSALLSEMLSLSPMTSLMQIGEPALQKLGFDLMLSWSAQGRRMSPFYVLEDRRLARAITDHHLARGVEDVGPSLGLALLQGVREGVAPLAVRRCAELCVHLHLSMCILEAERPEATESAALRALLDENAARLPDAQRVYWAGVRAALLLSGVALEVPDPRLLSTRAEALWHDARVRMDHPHIAAIGDPLARELGRRLPRVGARNRRADDTEVLVTR